MAAHLHHATAELFRALGHPVRIRVLDLLQDGPRPGHQLLAEVGIDASSLSHQLAVLRRCGIVRSSREGSTVLYALSSLAVGELVRLAGDTLASTADERAMMVTDGRRGTAGA